MDDVDFPKERLVAFKSPGQSEFSYDIFRACEIGIKDAQRLNIGDSTECLDMKRTDLASSDQPHSKRLGSTVHFLHFTCERHGVRT